MTTQHCSKCDALASTWYLDEEIDPNERWRCSNCKWDCSEKEFIRREKAKNNMFYNEYIQQLQRGETVKFRPKGNSMLPKIASSQLVTIVPATIDDLSDGKCIKVKT